MAVTSMGSRSERRDAIDRVVELFPVLSQRRRQIAGSLSGGEQQMLALARGIAVSPKLIIADEMSLGLAPKMVEVVFESLERTRSAGLTIVLIEQFVRRALEFGDSCILLQRGKLAWCGRASDAHEEVVARYLGASVGTNG